MTLRNKIQKVVYFKYWIRYNTTIMNKLIHKILSRCKGGPHQKTNKAIRKKEKQNLKKVVYIN